MPHARRVLSVTNGVEHRIEIIQRAFEPFKQVEAVVGLLQVKGRPAANHLPAMCKKVQEGVFEGQEARAAIDNGQKNDPKRILKRGHFIQLIEDDMWDNISLQFDNDAHALPVGLITQVGDAGNTFLVDQISNTLNQTGLIHLVRDLMRNNTTFSGLLVLFYRGPRPHLNDAPPGFIGAAYS